MRAEDRNPHDCPMLKTHHPDLRKLRHLNATITNFIPAGRGNCMQQAVAMVMDVPTAQLVIGTIVSDRDYLHAWVKDRGVFYDPSRIVEDGGLKPYHKDHYIKQERASDIHIVNRKWVLDFANRGALSRWMISTDDTYHSFPGIMGHVLLDELHISYFVNDDGFIFPKNKAA